MAKGNVWGDKNKMTKNVLTSHIVAIGKPKRQVRKASRYGGSKQQ